MGRRWRATGNGVRSFRTPAVTPLIEPEPVMIANQKSRAELQLEVEDLLAAYVEVIDDDRLEAWPGLFTEDCVYQVMPRENADRGLPLATIFCDSRDMLVDRVVSLRQANIYPFHHYRHILSQVRIAGVDADGIRAQTNYLVLQTRGDGETRVYSAGKYLDHIVAEDGRLKFKEKIVLCDTGRVDTLLVRPL